VFAGNTFAEMEESADLITDFGKRRVPCRVHNTFGGHINIVLRYFCPAHFPQPPAHFRE
jgi:hypothetical protein